MDHNMKSLRLETGNIRLFTEKNKLFIASLIISNFRFCGCLVLTHLMLFTVRDQHILVNIIIFQL